MGVYVPLKDIGMELVTEDSTLDHPFLINFFSFYFPNRALEASQSFQRQTGGLWAY
jgi:hypothetical protein